MIQMLIILFNYKKKEKEIEKLKQELTKKSMNYLSQQQRNQKILNPIFSLQQKKETLVVEFLMIIFQLFNIYLKMVLILKQKTNIKKPLHIARLKYLVPKEQTKMPKTKTT